MTAFVMLNGGEASEESKVIFYNPFRLLNILFKVNPFLESEKMQI